MPWPREQKQRSRERILKSAFSLFATRGYDSVTIADVMREAEMTHGAFYNHFGSKQELYAEAITAGARESGAAKMAAVSDSGVVGLAQLLEAYLDESHARDAQSPCPLAFLATDVANREEEVRRAYTQVFKRLVRLIDQGLLPSPGSSRSQALAIAAMMVGGVAVARALDDSKTASALLKACNAVGNGLLQGKGESSS
jgi:TetR/AcrR family transcriptional repressor of nem operon